MNIPSKVIKRLSLYHYILNDIDGQYVSSAQIAQLLKIDNSQVRKDIKYINNPGKCRVGYDVKELKKAIEKNLGFKQKRNAFIIGAGNVGSALAKYDNFKVYGLNIIAMFDNNEAKIGSNINGTKVYNITKIGEMVKQSKVDIAILTVPKHAANEIADRLVRAGIKYIWNFTPKVLDVPEGVKVWHENLVGTFLQIRNIKG